MKVVGLGGSMAELSRSRTALGVSLEGAASAGADTEILALRELALPMFNPDDAPGDAASRLIDSCYAADAMVWASPLYQGSISGAFKNALDWLHDLGARDPSFLHDKVVGLISTAGGIQGLQAVNAMEFSARALRAWTVPYVVPIGPASRVFAEDGRIVDDSVAAQLRTLGEEVVRAAGRFAADRTIHREHACDEASDRVALAGVS
jgi:FMN reductase